MAFAGSAGGRKTPRGYFRWLRFWGAVLRAIVRAPSGRRLQTAVRCLILTDHPAQELLLKGFPALVAVPEALFPTLRETPGLAVFPRAASAEELLDAVRALERTSGRRCDWDAVLTACEEQNRRNDALLSLAAHVRSLAGARLDTASARTALAALAEELAHERNKEI